MAQAQVVQGTGHGLLYSFAPTLTGRLQGTIVKTYDGTASASVGGSNLVVDGLLNGDVLSLSQAPNAVFTTAGTAASITEVGTGKNVNVNASILTATNGLKTIYGYVLTTPVMSGPGEIVKAPITLTMSKPYDGTVGFSNSNTHAVTGTFNGDVVSLNPGGSANVSSANAGSYTSLLNNAFSITSDRYTLDGANYAITISKAPLNVVVAATYDSSTALVPTLQTVQGLQNGETMVVTGFTAQHADVASNGANKVTALTSTTGTADVNNYTVSVANSPVTIDRKKITLVGTLTASKTYDGNRSASVVTTGVTPSLVLGTDNLSVAAIAGLFDSENVSNNRVVSVTGVTFAGTSANNYAWDAASAQTATGTIVQLPSATWVGALGGNWNDGANWGVTGNLTQTGVLPNLSNVALAIIGTGKQVVANAANGYTGKIELAGSLQVADDSFLGAVPTSTTADLITIDGGTLHATADVFMDAKRGITLTNNGASFQVDASKSLNYEGVIQGTGGLTKSGSGTMVVSGANSYTSTTISAGTLQVGNGSTTGSLGTGAVTVNGSLAFNYLDNLTLGYDISGSGGLVQMGSNQLTFTGAQNYTGVTNSGPVGSRLVFTNNTVPTTSGFTGQGALTIQPLANASFAIALNSSAYTFATTLSGLTIGHDANSADITLGNAVSIAGPVRLYGGALALNANLTTTDAVTGDVLLKGTSVNGAFNMALANSRTLTINNANTSRMTGIISGTGVSLVKPNAGSLQLMGNNTYTGGSSIGAGNVGLFHNNALGTGSVTFADATTLTLGRGVTAVANDIVLLGTTAVNFDTALDYLVVGGGGGGGSGTPSEHGGGGGGAGGVISGTTSSMLGGSYTVTVGTGGAAGNAGGSAAVAQGLGGNGGNSVLDGFTANGGGGGAVYWPGGAAKTGASGGGGAVSATAANRTGAAGTQGFAGGGASRGDFDRAAGGGGGAGGVGGSFAGNTGGAGGLGVSNGITGASLLYAAGGGGGGFPGGSTVGGAGAGAVIWLGACQLRVLQQLRTRAVAVVAASAMTVAPISLAAQVALGWLSCATWAAVPVLAVWKRGVPAWPPATTCTPSAPWARPRSH